MNLHFPPPFCLLTSHNCSDLGISGAYDNIWPLCNLICCVQRVPQRHGNLSINGWTAFHIVLSESMHLNSLSLPNLYLIPIIPCLPPALARCMDLYILYGCGNPS